MLLTSSLFIILSNAVSVFNKTSLLYSRVTNLTLLTGCFLIYVGYNELELSLCGGLVHFNYTIQTFSFFILLVSALILNLTSYFPYVIKKDELVDNNLPIKKDALKIITNKEKYLNGIFKQFKITEYSVIILLVVIGATLLISSLDLVSIFLCIELQSYGLYILCTINKDSESSTAAGLTYFLLGSLASCLILLGQGFLYANTGNTNLENFQVITSLSDTSLFSNINYIFFYIQLSLVILSVGFLFKISASPFHFWSPDVYDAIPTIVTTFVAIVAKISILILLLELINYTYKDIISYNWTNVLLLSSLLSLLVGTILGLTQTRLKRLYAYSTISHVGYILLALSIYSTESLQAFFFYLIQYSLSNVNIFFITLLIGYSFFLYKKENNNNYLIDKNINKLEIYNSPLQLISQLKGYFYVNPMLALSLSIALFSFVGIPPLTGFFAKQMVLSAALNKGYIFITFVAILTSVISAVYYLMIIKEMFFADKTSTEISSSNTSLVTNLNTKLSITMSDHLVDIISILTLLILVFILFIKLPINFFYIVSYMIF